MRAKKNKEMCLGCTNEHYQFEKSGCWYYKRAKVVHKTRVGIWQNPPYSWNPIATLSCHQPEDFCWIDNKDVRLKKKRRRGSLVKELSWVVVAIALILVTLRVISILSEH